MAEALSLFPRMPFWSVLFAVLGALLIGCSEQAAREDEDPPFSIDHPVGLEVDRDPAWGPDGRTLAYVHRDTLWLMDLPTRQKRSLGVAGHSPDWSPDGKSLAYECGPGYGQSICRLDVATGAVEQLTRDMWAVSPAWSPDGSRILFRRPSKYPGSVWMIGLPQARVDSIPVQHYDAGYPEWVSDEEFITSSAETGWGSEELVLNHLRTGASQRLSQTPGSDRYPAYSRVIKRLAWHMSNGTASSGIWMMNLDGSNQRLVIPRAALPSWSPDGSKIAYYRYFSEAESCKTSIWIANADGSNAHLLTRPEDYPNETWPAITCPSSR